MRTDGMYFPIVQNNDLIRMLNRGDTLCDNDFRCILQGCQTFPDTGLCSGIDGTGGIIENQYLRTLQQCPCNTKTLLLSAGDIDASLIHEAAIGKIAGEQILKLQTLGLTEEEAEEKIIAGFLKG